MGVEEAGGVPTAKVVAEGAAAVVAVVAAVADLVVAVALAVVVLPVVADVAVTAARLHLFLTLSHCFETHPTSL